MINNIPREIRDNIQSMKWEKFALKKKVKKQPLLENKLWQ